MAELTGLRLEDFSDRELLLCVEDHGDEEGWVSSSALAVQLGINNEWPTRSVGSRMAWLKRYGAVEGGAGRWRLSPIGQLLASGTLTKAEIARIESFEPEKLLLVTRVMTGRVRGAPETAQHLLLREWRRGAVLRRNGAGLPV